MERIAEIQNCERLFLQAIKENNLDLRDKQYAFSCANVQQGNPCV
jgi:hypothetical protein